MKEKAPEILVILGPTASGKTMLACHAASELNGEIISADSRQVYRNMNIGTGKDLSEYDVRGKKIPHHLIDIRDAGYKYNIAEFEADFVDALEAIKLRNNVPILCGGSGLYIEAALKGNSLIGIPANRVYQDELESKLDSYVYERFSSIAPELQNLLAADTKRRRVRAIEIDEFLKSHPEWKTEQRKPPNAKIFGIDVDRIVRRNCISNRLQQRMKTGLIEEVEDLLKNSITEKDLDYYGLEYKWVGQFIAGKVSKDEMILKLEIAIHQFAKRQMTWFRGMQRRGFEITWVAENLSLEEKVNLIVDGYKI